MVMCASECFMQTNIHFFDGNDSRRTKHLQLSYSLRRYYDVGDESESFQYINSDRHSHTFSKINRLRDIRTSIFASCIGSMRLATASSR